MGVLTLHLQARRRQIAAKGRTMTLIRQSSPPVNVALLGVQRAFRPEQITGGVQQGGALVAILNDEIAAASWPGPPRARDAMLIDGKTWAVLGADAIWEGVTLLGYRLWVRGGA